MSPALGWTVLALVFVDEVLAAVAAGVWGADAGGWPAATASVLVVVAVWWSFASPRAPYGGRIVRPVVTVLVFGLASLGLAVAGHPGWAVVLLVYSAVVNGLAPPVPDLARELATSRGKFAPRRPHFPAQPGKWDKPS